MNLKLENMKYLTDKNAGLKTISSLAQKSIEKPENMSNFCLHHVSLSTLKYIF